MLYYSKKKLRILKQYKKPRTLGSKDSGMPENKVNFFLYIWYGMHYPKIGLEKFDKWIILGAEIFSYFIKEF